MLPMLVLVGLMLGASIRDRHTAIGASIVACGASVSWGVVVGLVADRPEVVLGGTALGVANVVAGAACSASVRSLLHLARRFGAHATIR